MQVFCQFCGRKKDMDLPDDMALAQFGPCECDMGDFRVIDFAPDEATTVISALARTESVFRDILREGVLVWPQIENVDVWLLDLYVLLYEHVLVDAGMVALADDGGVLARRVERFSQAGAVTPIYFESKGYHRVHNGDRNRDEPFASLEMLDRYAINLIPFMREALGSRESATLLRLVDEIASFEVHQSFGELLRPDAQTPIARLAKESYRESAPYASQFEFGVRRLTRLQLLASLFGASPLIEPSLSPIASAVATSTGGKLPTDIKDVGTQLAPTVLYEWYKSRTSDLRRFEDPDTVLALREAAGDEFMDRVCREVRHTTDLAGLRNVVPRRLDRTIGRSRALVGRPITQAAVGTVATVGGFVGGPFGAVFGGLGAAGVSYFSERWAARNRNWVSFFASR